jgi:parallel beta-helix repeat protein
MSRYIDSHPQFFDDNGNPLSNGSIEFFDPGTTGTSNRKDTYSDKDLTIPNPNPIALDDAGRTVNPVWLDGEYNTIIRDRAGNQIDQVDNVIGVFDFSTAKSILAFDTIQLAADNTTVYAIGTIATVKSFRLVIPEVARGGAEYTVVATGGTPSGTVTVLPENGQFVDQAGNVWQLIDDQIFNPYQFGCAGDDSTVDTTPMQNAIRFTSGKRLDITAGTFIVRDLDPVNDMYLFGAGGTLKLESTSSDQTSIFRYQDAVTHISKIKIDGVNFDGNRSNQSTSFPLQVAAFDCGNVSDVEIINCAFKNTLYFVLRIDGRIGTPIIGNSSAKNIHITNNTFIDTWGTATLVFNCENLIVSNNSYQDVGTPGGSGAVWPDGGAGQCITAIDSKQVSITGNTIVFCSDSAIYCIGCDGGTITGNTVRNSAKTGIKWQDGCERVIISSNTVLDVGAQGINVWASDAESTCQEAVITGNVVRNTGYTGTKYAQVLITQTNGIFCQNASKVTISGNTVTDAGIDGVGVVACGIRVQDGGTFINITGNTVSNSWQHGIEAANISRVNVTDNMTFNNGKQVTGIHNGIFVNAGSKNVQMALISNNHCFDNQVTKTQDYGIQTAGSLWGEAIIEGNSALISDHVTGGIANTATNINLSQSLNRTRSITTVSREKMQSFTLEESAKWPSLSANPADIENGQIVYADGIGLNPGGGGEGFYGRVAGAWVKLH